MREIYYALYRKTPFDVLLNTLLAEAVLRKYVQCTDKNVKPIPGGKLSDIERIVLDRIVFGQRANIKIKHIRELRSFYLSECIEKEYIKKLFLIGFRKTRRFKKAIKSNLKESFNPQITKYVETHDINQLKLIVKRIDLIQYPSFVSQQSSRIGLYKDRLAMQNAAIAHRYGIQHPPPGK